MAAATEVSSDLDTLSVRSLRGQTALRRYCRDNGGGE